MTSRAGLGTDERMALLREVELFRGVADAGLAAIAAKATEVAFDAGRTIVRQGEVGTGFFLIVSGIAQVLAEEPTDCLALASWDFESILASEPGVALAILRGVAQRLRTVSEDHRH